jgi:6-phospho-beta-glucosidase
MQQVLGVRAIGICDSPIALGRRAAAALGLDPARVHLDYVGLNHLGWLRGIEHAGRDVLPELLADEAALDRIEEVRLIGADWVRALGALPNEYLFYYYCGREAVAELRSGGSTRGQFLAAQQQSFFAGVRAAPAEALTRWNRTRDEREATYMATERAGSNEGAGTERDAADLESGGYEAVALALMHAIARNERASLILNVCGAGSVAGLRADAVVEVPCLVDAAGPRPLAVAPVTGHQLGLMQQLKEVEQLTVEAALSGSRSLALKAFALHPLVGSISTARALVHAYLDG